MPQCPEMRENESYRNLLEEHLPGADTSSSKRNSDVLPEELSDCLGDVSEIKITPEESEEVTVETTPFNEGSIFKDTEVLEEPECSVRRS